MTSQLVWVHEKGSPKGPIKIHSSCVPDGVQYDIFELIDPDWELIGNEVRRKSVVGQAPAKRRRGRPPKVEAITSEAIQ